MIDPNPDDWLGHFTNKNRISDSGLWNSDFVDNTQIENEFWELLSQYIDKTN